MKLSSTWYSLPGLAVGILMVLSGGALYLCHRAIDERFQPAIELPGAPPPSPRDQAYRGMAFPGSQALAAEVGPEKADNRGDQITNRSVPVVPPDLQAEVYAFLKLDELLSHDPRSKEEQRDLAVLPRRIDPLTLVAFLQTFPQSDPDSPDTRLCRRIKSEKIAAWEELRLLLDTPSNPTADRAIARLSAELFQVYARDLAGCRNVDAFSGNDDLLQRGRRILTLCFMDLFRWTWQARERLSSDFLALNESRDRVYRRLYDSLCLVEETAGDDRTILTGRIGGDQGRCQDGLYCEAILSPEAALESILFELD